MHLFMSYIVLAIGVLIAGALCRLGLQLALADKVEAKKSAARVSSIRDAIFGRARILVDWMPDARVKGGMIYNRKKKRLEITGRLSDDSFDRVFRR